MVFHEYVKQKAVRSVSKCVCYYCSPITKLFSGGPVGTRYFQGIYYITHKSVQALYHIQISPNFGEFMA
jgi:hypothetical protein